MRPWTWDGVLEVAPQHKRPEKTRVNWTSPKLRTSVHQRTVSGKRKPIDGKKVFASHVSRPHREFLKLNGTQFKTGEGPYDSHFCREGRRTAHEHMRSHSGISHPSAVIREARRETVMTGPFAPTRMARGNEGKERASARSLTPRWRGRKAASR